jgi:hypothetical protein
MTIATPSVDAMRVLQVLVDVGPDASPATLEVMVRAIRVATDVGAAARLVQIRRLATEAMKFPSDGELASASERLSPLGAENSLAYRATSWISARRRLREEWRNYPPDFWRERYWRDSKLSWKEFGAVSAQLQRLSDGATGPSITAFGSGLDVLDPELYAALVADRVARESPSAASVRSLDYRNPLAETLTAVGTGAEALSKTAGVVETLATLGSRRKIKKAEAEYAEQTIDDRVEGSHLDRRLKEEELRRARINNDLAEAQLLEQRINNAQALVALEAQAKQRLADQLQAAGKLDEADVARALEPSDAAALTQLSARDVEVTESEEPDPED